jgi:SPP1 family predicted phage head-tail adaptor
MEFAKLNQRIILLEHRAVKDEIGNHITKWEEICSMWAKAEVSNLQSSSEKTDSGVVKENRTIVFTVRQNPYLININSTTHRILFREQIYNIISVIPDYTNNSYMTLNCTIREAGVKHDE